MAMWLFSAFATVIAFFVGHWMDKWKIY
jgi:hypothetical protein